MTAGYLFNQQIQDAYGNFYRIVAKTDDDNVLHVTPVNGNHGGMSYCIKHQITFTHKETCAGCRDQVLEEPIGGSVTSCDTPEFHRN